MKTSYFTVASIVLVTVLGAILSACSGGAARSISLTTNNPTPTPTPTVTPTPTPTDPVSSGSTDPYFTSQWHLLNTGQLGGTAGEDLNVSPVWDSCGTGSTCRGEGVRIAIVDDGLELAHEDLAANIVADASYNYLDGGTDPTTGGHGTSVAGLIAARDWNGLGGRGVAPRAGLVGYNFLQNPTQANEVDAMTRGSPNISVSSNSWGVPDGEGLLSASGSLWRSAISEGLSSGRSGKGTIYVWAAGNGADGSNACPTCVDNSNYDGLANNSGVIAVCAVNDKGKRSAYSELGANLTVCAPGGEYCDTHTLTTTDRTGNAGMNTSSTAGQTDYLNTNYTKCMNGTSGATPLISGVVALMLQANPALGWRDVRWILAASARKNDPSEVGWFTNGGGFHFNDMYGFGVADAAAAVTLAKTWTNFGTEKLFSSAPKLVNTAIADNNPTPVSSTISVSGSQISKIEFVEITFSATDHPYSGDLLIRLLNETTGTFSALAYPHNCVDSTCTAYDGWVFGSMAHLGESADGNWTLQVSDRGAGDTGTFQSWGLKIHGH